MTWTLGDDDLFSAKTLERINSRFDNRWVGVDHAFGIELDEVRLQQNPLVGNIQTEQFYST